MARIEKTVFISYRRTNLPWALAIYQNLTAHNYDVFFDFQSINSGDFEQVILGNIKARAHFLIVLTPSALERCVEPNDWLRREIETALDEKRNIVPLFLEGFNFGSPSIKQYLTGKIAEIKNYNGLNIPADYFDEALERLRQRYLNVALDAVLHPLSNKVVKVVKEQQVAADQAKRVKQKELSAQEWFEKGFRLNDNSDEEIRFYTQAIRLKHDYAEAFNNRGVARCVKGDLDGAIKDHTEVLRIRRNDADAYYNRGLAHQDKGDLDNAIKDYTEAIRLRPDNADAFNNRGLARRVKSDLDGAIKDYNKALNVRRDDADAYYNRGLAHQDKGDLDSAIKDHTEALRIRRNDADAYYYRGLAHQDKGNLDDAIKDYTEAIRLRPDYADAFNNLGLALYDKGNLDSAVKEYDEAIRLKPNDAETYYNRAILLDQKRDYSKAVADYQKYLDLGGGIREGDQKEVEGFIRALKKKIK